jgi:hypothetical protein
MTEPLAVIEFQPAKDSGIKLFPGTGNEAWVRGVNAMKPPGLSREQLEIMEFQRDFSIKKASGGSIGTITIKGNMVVGDTTGQDILRTYLKNGTQFTNDIRFYINSTDFYAADLGTDLGAGFEVLNWEFDEADKNGIYSYSGEFVVNGNFALYTAHITADTIALVSGSPDTVTDSGSGFVTAGFTDAMSIIIEDSAADDGGYLTTTAVAGTITMDEDVSMTGEAAGTSITIHGGLM